MMLKIYGNSGLMMIYRSLPHRKLLLDNTTTTTTTTTIAGGGKLITPVAIISPTTDDDDVLTTLPSDCTQIVLSTVRHTSVTSTLVLFCVGCVVFFAVVFHLQRMKKKKQ